MRLPAFFSFIVFEQKIKKAEKLDFTGFSAVLLAPPARIELTTNP